MLARALVIVERLVLNHPRVVLGIALLLTLLAGWQGTGIELRTSRRELVSEVDRPQQRYDEMTAELGETQPLIVVLEARPGSGVDLGAAASEMAARMGSDPEVARVFFRLEPDWVVRAAPWLIDPDVVTAAVQQADALLTGADGRAALSDLAALDDRIATRIEEALATGSALPEAGGVAEAERLARLLDAQADFLADPAGAADRLAGAPVRAAADEMGIRIRSDGVYGSADGDRVFVFVVASNPDGGLPTERHLVGLARTTLADLARSRPGLTGGLTGRAAMNVEEMETIARDGRNTSALALVGVMVLASIAFHWRRHALLGLGVLAMGVIWALAWVELQIGYLNMISTAMIPILIGIGIDYAVHPLSQYELERLVGDDRRQAVRRTFRKTAPAVVVSALTTASAFACFLFMEFRGFAELGEAASVGVLLCLGAALVVLPALLVVAGKAPDGGAEPSAIIDRFWGRRAIDAICRRPATVVTVAAAVTLLALLGAREVRLRSNLLELLPPSAESLRYLERVDESSFGAWFNVVIADDLDQLRAWQELAAEHEEIRRFDSAARLLPADLGASRAATGRLGDFLGRLAIELPADDDPGRLPAALVRLEAALAEAAETAFTSGQGALSGALERGRAAAERAAATVAGGATSEQLTEQRRLVAVVRDLRDATIAAVAAGPPSMEELPADVRDHFVSPAGRWVGYLYARHGIFEPGFLPRFNAASRAVSPAAIGFPMLFEAHAAGITDGFRLALGVGALLVLLLLAIDLRRPSHVVLALLPVVVGLIWMLGAMALLGLSFNFANLVAIPLVLGVGIDAGIHVVHRFRLEGAAGMRLVMEHTGRALLIASLTTMVGFGSLMLAHHRGMAGLGALLFIGVGASLLVALIVLPNLFLLLRIADR